MLRQIEVEARIVLGTGRMRLRDLVGLERGSVVALDVSVDSPSQLSVNGVTVALGDIRLDGNATRFAVRETLRGE